MPAVRVLILRAAGTNCDLETQHAWELAGARCTRVHVRELIDRPTLLDDYQILTVPGGFSYGDDIAAGRILAAQLLRHVSDRLREFADRGKLMLGICNGFQVLVQCGLLPGVNDGDGRTCTIAANHPPGFQDRWVNLSAGVDHCVFLDAGGTYEMPIAHGEGRVTFASEAALESALAAGCGALRYVPSTASASTADGLPSNPNGSDAALAGLCDSSGRILGLMPHPERFVRWDQHPCWTSQPPRPAGDGLTLFRNAVAFFK